MSLLQEVKMLQNSIKTNGDEIPMIISKCNNFKKRLKISQTIFSPTNFYTVTLLSVEIMILLYVIPNQINTIEGMDFVAIWVTTGTTVYLITLCLLMWYINIWSHETFEKVHELKNDLKDLPIIDTDTKIELENHSLPICYIKQRIEERLNDFQGFDGKGYFILGKSLLKNLLAFCSTYFVILTQFKLTEPTLSVQNLNDTNTMF